MDVKNRHLLQEGGGYRYFPQGLPLLTGKTGDAISVQP